jgi:hypothetical protein
MFKIHLPDQRESISIMNYICNYAFIHYICNYAISEYLDYSSSTSLSFIDEVSLITTA